MYQAEIYVSYKESILDPQGQAIKNAVHQMNYSSIESVRQGKYFEMTLEDTEQHPEQVVQEVADKLLANINTEQFVYTIWHIDPQTGARALVADTKCQDASAPSSLQL